MSKLLREIVVPYGPDSGTVTNWLLLALRVIFGGLLMSNGIIKILDYGTLSATFADPIGLGSQVSVTLVIFAEVFCAFGVICGLFFRLSLIPVIVTMFIAALVTLGNAGWSHRQLPVSFLMVFLLLMITGPGAYSLDKFICRWFRW